MLQNQQKGLSKVATKLAKKQMKPLSFSDGYALGLIARNPDDDWTEVQEHLSKDAQKIAKELITPSPRASREVKSAAEDLRSLIRKIENSSSA